MKPLAIALLMLPLLLTPLRAEEGMFELHRLPEQALKKAGLRVAPKKLRDLSKAVLRVHTGSGAFVSPRGLLITNYHIAYSCLNQLNSTKKHRGLLARGHLARTGADEIHCPGFTVDIPIDAQHVTKIILMVVRDTMTPADRRLAIQRQKKALVNSCQKRQRSKGIVCRVATMDGGTSWVLTEVRRLRDVRLVYAPPHGLGKYGGKVDNWMYPRHSGDFALLRAYGSPNGGSSGFNKQHTPVASPKHLQISSKGPQKGALNIVIGFPWQTYRHLSSHAIRFDFELRNPTAVAVLSAYVRLLHRLWAKNPTIKTRYRQIEYLVQNSLKYYRMALRGMTRWKVLHHKLEQEKRLIAQLKRRRKSAEFGSLLPKLGRLYQNRRSYFHKLMTLNRLTGWASRSVKLALALRKWSTQNLKPRTAKALAARKRMASWLKRFDDTVEISTEKALVLFLLKTNQSRSTNNQLRATSKLLRWAKAELKRSRKAAATRKIPFERYYRATYKAEFSADRLKRAVDMMFGLSGLVSHTDSASDRKKRLAYRLRLLDLKPAQLTGERDPLVWFAKWVKRESSALNLGPKRRDDLLAQQLHPNWVAGVKRPTYPDANNTLRLAYGFVRDYTNSKTGQKHRYLTGVSGLLKKDRGKFPFLVPARFKSKMQQRRKSRWFDKRIGDVPVNFTNTLDTTGGNSGSPVLNRDGQLIGLMFDGTAEGVISDWLYRKKEQRSVCLDIRYAMYILELDGATALLTELGFKP